MGSTKSMPSIARRSRSGQATQPIKYLMTQEATSNTGWGGCGVLQVTIISAWPMLRRAKTDGTCAEAAIHASMRSGERRAETSRCDGDEK